MIKTIQKEMSDVWTLETDKEKKYSDYLTMICQTAMDGNKKAQNYLRKIWDNETWQSIKEKLETEGSVWYVWFMDGVSKLMTLE